MALKPAYIHKSTSRQRPVYATVDRHSQMPLAQEFLHSCYSGHSDLHSFWVDIVESYALRSMSNMSDRLTALSGLAARYLSASRLDEYVVGLWDKHLSEGLAWRVERAVEIDKSMANLGIATQYWPSWSWAVLPLQTAIKINKGGARSSYFQRLGDDSNVRTHADGDVEAAIKRGESVKTIHISGRMRALWRPSSQPRDWSDICEIVDGEEKFTFGTDPGQEVHALEPITGRILVYEDRKS